MISHGQKHGSRSQIQVSRRLRTKFTVSLLEVVLGLLQPLHPVLDLQVGLRLLEMVPNDFPWPKHGSRSQIQVSRRLRTEVIVSLLDVVLGLLQPLHPVHDLQVGLRLLKMVPNDCPWPKN